MLNEEVKQRLVTVRQKIAAACAAAGRNVDAVKLIAVSKFHPVERVIPALENGVSALGENHVQELLPKQIELAEAGWQPEWHFIGTLQSNKVRQIIGKVDLIHSVDRPSLVKELNKRALQNEVVQPVLLQVNYSGVENKQGYPPEELRHLLLEEVADYPGIEVRGLMTMAELGWSSEQLERFYAEVQAYWQELKSALTTRDVERGRRFDLLSMGMSNDYEIAIRHGSTHVRVGTAIFGAREYN